MFVPYYQDTTPGDSAFASGATRFRRRAKRMGWTSPSALIAAGAVSQDSADAMAIGKAIYKMLQDGVPGKPRKAQPRLRRVRLWINRYRLTRLPLRRLAYR